MVAMRLIVGFGVGGRCRRRFAAAAGVPAGVEARLGQRAVDRPVAAGSAAGGGHGRLVRNDPRLARHVRGRPAAGAHGIRDPRLGAGIAALADRRGTHRGGAPLARLGSQARSRRGSGCRLRFPKCSRVSWVELFKYPRSIAASCLTGLSQTGSVGLALWQVTLLVLLLNVPPAQAAYLSIWIALIGIAGRAFGAWLSDADGPPLRRRPVLRVVGRHDAGRRLFCTRRSSAAISVFYLMLLANSFFANGNFAVVFPYMAELWPARLRASGFGLVYGLSNLGKFIGPAGLAVIAGASNFVAPKATLDALVPGLRILRRLVCTGHHRLPVRRHRDARPHDRRTRCRAGAAGTGEGGCRLMLWS